MSTNSILYVVVRRVTEQKFSKNAPFPMLTLKTIFSSKVGRSANSAYYKMSWCSWTPHSHQTSHSQGVRMKHRQEDLPNHRWPSRVLGKSLQWDLCIQPVQYNGTENEWINLIINFCNTTIKHSSDIHSLLWSSDRGQSYWLNSFDRGDRQTTVGNTKNITMHSNSLQWW